MTTKRIISIIMSIAIIIGCLTSCEESPKPITQDVGEVTLSKGVNLSALEDKYKSSSYLDKKSTYTEIVKKGFDHIRLPVDFRIFSDDKGTLNEKSFKRIDNIINTANNEGLAVMLDFHGWNDFNTEKGDSERFIAIWKNVAERYKDFSNLLLFELINEPHTTEGGDLSMGKLMRLQNEAIDAIRAISPDRTIVISTAEWNGPWTLKDFTPPEYDNLILALHTYEPLDFTHQGMKWAGTEDVKLALTDDMLINLRTQLNLIVEFKERTGMKVILNEFGLNTTGHISDKDVKRYLSTVTKVCSENDIPWTYWSYNGQFGFYNSNAFGIGAGWRENVLDSLFLHEREKD